MAIWAVYSILASAAFGQKTSAATFPAYRQAGATAGDFGRR